MKKARLIFLGFVLACGGGATWLVLDRGEPAPVANAPPPQPPQLEQVLVAAHELGFGAVVQASDFAWQGWPKETAPQGVIRKSETPAAMDELKDSVVRGAFLAGEPIRRDKLFKGNSGYLSALIAPGYRAVAVTIEGSGATTAGNLILPNDRVDVIRVSRDEDAVKSGVGDVFVSETLVTNVRVLAIGQNALDKGGQTFATGATATLELDPRQAESIVLAQRVGQLSLVLRSLQDSRGSVPVAVAEDKHDRAVTVVRAGAASQLLSK